MRTVVLSVHCIDADRRFVVRCLYRAATALERAAVTVESVQDADGCYVSVDAIAAVIDKRSTWLWRNVLRPAVVRAVHGGIDATEILL